MARKAVASASTPSTLKKSASSGGQKTLHGFFSKTPSATPSSTLPSRSTPTSKTTPSLKGRLSASSSASQLTPVPSSDAPEAEEDELETKASRPASAKGLPSPVSADEGQTHGDGELSAFGTPSRRVSTPTMSCTQSLILRVGEEEVYQLC